MKQFEDVQGIYEWRKNAQVSAGFWKRVGPWWNSRRVFVHSDPESAYEMGRLRGYCDAIEEVYEL